MDAKLFLVTGPTGNVGHHVVTQLLDLGQRVRVFVRDPRKVAHWDGRVEIAVGDFGQPETFSQAVAGVDGIFLMSANPDQESFRQLVAAAATQGKPQVVFLSTILAEEPGLEIGQWQKAKEDLLRASGLPTRVLRPSAFMSNAYQWIGTIKAESTVYNAMGRGQFAPIAPEDIAAVAVRALTAPDLADEVFELTGSELLTLPTQVEILSQALGRTIQCIDVPTETVVQNFVRNGIPAHVAAAVGKSFEAVRNGRVVVIKDAIERVTGRPPKTFAAWAREHASRFA